MTGKTHLGSGILASLFLCNDIASGIVLCVGSLLPDIDHQNSLFGKYIPLINRLFKHRGFTHSLIFVILCGLLNIWLCIGVIVHILFDMLTRNGVEFFYPYRMKIRIPIVSNWVSTGGLFEKCILYVIYGMIFYIGFLRMI